MNGKPDKIELLTEYGPIDITDSVRSVDVQGISRVDLAAVALINSIRDFTVSLRISGENMRDLVAALELVRKTKNRGIRPRNQIR